MIVLVWKLMNSQESHTDMGESRKFLKAMVATAG